MMLNLLILPILLGWQVQGGAQTRIQADSSHIQAPLSVIQADQEQGDNLQTAMGYATLEWVVQPINPDALNLQAALDSGGLTLDK